MSDLEYMPIGCKSMLGFRAIALMFSVENFFNGCMSVGYGVEVNFYLLQGLVI